MESFMSIYIVHAEAFEFSKQVHKAFSGQESSSKPLPLLIRKGGGGVKGAHVPPQKGEDLMSFNIILLVRAPAPRKE